MSNDAVEQNRAAHYEDRAEDKYPIGFVPVAIPECPEPEQDEDEDEDELEPDDWMDEYSATKKWLAQQERDEMAEDRDNELPSDEHYSQLKIGDPTDA